MYHPIRPFTEFVSQQATNNYDVWYLHHILDRSDKNLNSINNKNVTMLEYSGGDELRLLNEFTIVWLCFFCVFPSNVIIVFFHVLAATALILHSLINVALQRQTISGPSYVNDICTTSPYSVYILNMKKGDVYTTGQVHMKRDFFVS